MSKRNVLLALTALLITAGSAFAQSAKFNVPFQFTIDKMLMPAGNYSIKSANPAWQSSGVLIIQGVGSTARSRFLNTNPLQSVGAQDQSKLVFHCYGDSCFLSQVWTGDNVGRQLRMSSYELELAKQGLALRAPIVAAVR
jgi:hypothetical protein